MAAARQEGPPCAVCGAKAAFRCTGCRHERYCSQACQRQHWPTHRPSCVARQAVAPVASTASPALPGASSAGGVPPAARHDDPVRAAQAATAAGSAPPPLPPSAPQLRPTPPSGPRPPSITAPPAPSTAAAGEPTPPPAAPGGGGAPQRPAAGAFERGFLTRARRLVVAAALRDVPASGAEQAAPPPATTQPDVPTAPPLPASAPPLPPLRPAPPPGGPRPPPAAAPAAPSTEQQGVARRPLPFLKRGFLAAGPPPAAAPEAAATTTASKRPEAAAAASHGGQQRLLEGPASPGQVHRLPRDVLQEVFLRLPAADLAAARRVCREWRQAGGDDGLWWPHVADLALRLPPCWLDGGGGHAPACAPTLAGALAGGPPLGGGVGGPVRVSVSGDRHSLNHHLEATPAAATAPAGSSGVAAAAAAGDAAASLRPRPPPSGQAAFAVAGVQGVRLLRTRAAAAAASGAEAGAAGRTVLVPPAPPPPAPPPPRPPLSTLVGAALKQRTAWETGRYLEHRLQEHHSGNVECLAFADTALWGPVLVSAGWDGVVRVHQLWPRGPASHAPRAHGHHHQQQHQHRHQTSGDRQGEEPRARSSGGAQWRWEPGGEARGGGGAQAPAEPRCVCTFAGHSGWINGMAAGREHVLTSSLDKTVCMWRYGSGGQGAPPAGRVAHPCVVTLVRFAYAAPGCEALALSGGSDGVVRLLDVPAGQVLRSFAGHADAVWGLGRLPGGLLLSSSRDCTCKVWRLPRLLRRRRPAPAPAPPHSPLAALLQAQGAREGGGGGGDGAWEVAREGAGALAALLAQGRAHGCSVVCSVADGAPCGVGMDGPAECFEYACEGCQAPATGTSAHGAGGGHNASGDVRAAAEAAAAPVQELAPHASAVLCMDLYMHRRRRAVDDSARRDSGAAWHACSGCVGLGGGLGGAAPDQEVEVLVATGSGDGEIKVWASVQGLMEQRQQQEAPPLRLLHSLSKGHARGVISLRFGCLPLTGRSPPPVSSPALRPAAQEEQRSELLPGGPRPRKPVLFSGSVHEVLVWDVLRGTCLGRICEHAGPVTAIVLCDEHLATLAMNDGVLVYACAGISSSSGSGGQQPRLDMRPILSLQDGVSHRYACALVASPSCLAVGSSTGEVRLLDFAQNAALRCVVV